MISVLFTDLLPKLKQINNYMYIIMVFNTGSVLDLFICNSNQIYYFCSNRMWVFHSFIFIFIILQRDIRQAIFIVLVFGVDVTLNDYFNIRILKKRNGSPLVVYMVIPRFAIDLLEITYNKVSDWANQVFCECVDVQDSKNIWIFFLGKKLCF